jgi:hypothetical protein
MIGDHSKRATVRCAHATKSDAARFRIGIGIFVRKNTQIIHMLTELYFSGNAGIVLALVQEGFIEGSVAAGLN